MIEKSNLLVMVPAFNEQASVRAVLEQLQVHGFHVVLISDGSTDGTATIGRTCGVHVLELPINLGVGGALRAGFKFARRHGYQAVVQVDADGQHPVEEIEDLVRASNEAGAHMVIGSRFIGDGSPMKVTGIRRVAMWVLARSASAAANERITDSTSGFRLIREPLLEQFSMQFANNYLGDTYESVVSAGRAGYRIIEIPAGLRERKNGESTASTGSAVRFTIKGLGVWMLGFHKKLARFEDASR
jgi:glycosyltransferase involved in cell wall biosynthesis